MLTVVADTHDDCLILNRLAVSPLGILRTAFGAVGHGKKPAGMFVPSGIICIRI